MLCYRCPHASLRSCTLTKKTLNSAYLGEWVAWIKRSLASSISSSGGLSGSMLYVSRIQLKARQPSPLHTVPSICPDQVTITPTNQFYLPHVGHSSQPNKHPAPCFLQALVHPACIFIKPCWSVRPNQGYPTNISNCSTKVLQCHVVLFFLRLLKTSAYHLKYTDHLCLGLHLALSIFCVWLCVFGWMDPRLSLGQHAGLCVEGVRRF